MGAALLIFVGAAASDAQQAPADHFRRGVEFEKANNLDAARGEYEKAIALDPARIDARGNLGMVQLRLGDAAAAIASFETVLARRPEMGQVRFYLALAHYQTGRCDRAGVELDRLLAADPRDGRALHLAGMCLLKLDRIETGVDLLERAVGVNPANRAALLTLATAYASLKEHEKAEELLRGPLAGRETPETQLVRGTLLNAQGKYREAEAVLAAAAAGAGKLPAVRNELGYTRMLLGDYASARREFEAELRLTPGDFNASANLGWLLAQDREHARAAPLIAEALRQKPANPGLLYLMGQVHLAEGALEKAVEALSRAVELRPEFRAAHVLLARIFARLNRPDDVAREQAWIARLTREEQDRNAGSSVGYGGGAAIAPDFSPAKAARSEPK